MRIKKSLIIILLLAMFCGIFGCGDKNEDLDGEYIYLPQTELHTFDDFGGSYKEYKRTYEYDSYGNVVKKQEYTKGFWGWFNVREFCIDTTYTYDEDGKIVKELIREEDFCTNVTDGHWVHEDGYEYIYDESGLLIKKECMQLPTSGSLLGGYRYEYYDYGNRVREIRYYKDGTEVIEFEYHYDSNKRLIKKIYIFDDSIASNLIYNAEETEYRYDDDGKLIYSKQVFKDRWGGETHYIESTYIYDELSRLIKEESALFDFDENGEKTREEMKEYKDFIKIAVKD